MHPTDGGTERARSLAVLQGSGCAPGLLRLKGCGSTAGLGQLVVPVPIQEWLDPVGSCWILLVPLVLELVTKEAPEKWI